MAEKFIDLMELLRGRIDPAAAKEAGFGANFFINISLVYAAYAAYPTSAIGPSLQIRSAAGPYGFTMLSVEDAEIGAKIVIGAAQTTVDDEKSSHENMLQRYLVGGPCETTGDDMPKSRAMNESVDELKSDILQPRGDFGYVVPAGFLSEPFITNLHTALRELKGDRLIKRGPSPGAGYESWIGA